MQFHKYFSKCQSTEQCIFESLTITERANEKVFKFLSTTDMYNCPFSRKRNSLDFFLIIEG